MLGCLMMLMLAMCVGGCATDQSMDGDEKKAEPTKKQMEKQKEKEGQDKQKAKDKKNAKVSTKFMIKNPGCCACCQCENGCNNGRKIVWMQIAGTNRYVKMETCNCCKAGKDGIKNVCPTTMVVIKNGKYVMQAK